MKFLKKRTLALVLASVVTVAGSFAADNYRNSLMGLKFESKGNGNISLVLETKTAFSGNVTPVKKDVNTYVIMLPEMNSQAETPILDKVSAEVESVDIRTMPYTNAGSGYTRLTIRTYPNVQMSASSAVFIPAPPEQNAIEDKSVVDENKPQPLPNIPTTVKEQSTQTKPAEQTKIQENESTTKDIEKIYNEPSEQLPLENQDNNANYAQETVDTSHYDSGDSTEKLLIILGVLLIIVSSAYFFVKAKNKMENLLGESFEIDTSDEEQKPKEDKTKSDKKTKITTEKIDIAFSKTSSNEIKSAPSIKELDENNILDLDELFQEQKSATEKADLYKEDDEEENEALNDFLSGFSFTDEVEEFHIPAQNNLEPMIDKILENDNLVFTNEDIDKINNLLNMEVTDNTIDELKKNVTVPIKTPTKQEILENLVTTYKISQDISFTPSDMKILQNLINIEINPDFLESIKNSNDLTTSKEESLKTEEIIKEDDKNENEILNVKGILPDLNKAMQAQAGKRIECELKPQTIYFKEGFEFEKLSVDTMLSESNFTEDNISYQETEIKYVDDSYEVSTLSVENFLAESDSLDNEKTYKMEEVKFTDDSYEHVTLNVDGLLPKMEDVMKNPNKYTSSKKETESVKEEDLLSRLQNVTFKPFADEEQSYGDFNAEALEETFLNENIAKEEIDEKEDEIVESTQKEVEPIINVTKQTSQTIKNKIQQVNIKSNTETSQKTSEILIQKMEEAKRIREENKARLAQEKPKSVKHINTTNKNISYTKCILNGASYSIVATSRFGENIGCHLAKSKKNIVILGYVGDEISILKEYESVSNERLMSRLSETLPDGGKRYLIKVGANKIVVDVKDNKINYLMDLC